MIKESDWKKFKSLKAMALERFCARTLAECNWLIEQDGESSHSRYLSVYRMIHDADRKLASMFDGHSRSGAALQLMKMRHEGLVEDREL